MCAHGLLGTSSGSLGSAKDWQRSRKTARDQEKEPCHPQAYGSQSLQSDDNPDSWKKNKIKYLILI